MADVDVTAHIKPTTNLTVRWAKDGTTITISISRDGGRLALKGTPQDVRRWLQNALNELEDAYG